MWILDFRQQNLRLIFRCIHCHFEAASRFFIDLSVCILMCDSIAVSLLFIDRPCVWPTAQLIFDLPIFITQKRRAATGLRILQGHDGVCYRFSLTRQCQHTFILLVTGRDHLCLDRLILILDLKAALQSLIVLLLDRIVIPAFVQSKIVLVCACQLLPGCIFLGDRRI